MATSDLVGRLLDILLGLGLSACVSEEKLENPIGYHTHSHKVWIPNRMFRTQTASLFRRAKVCCLTDSSLREPVETHEQHNSSTQTATCDAGPSRSTLLLCHYSHGSAIVCGCGLALSSARCRLFHQHCSISTLLLMPISSTALIPPLLLNKPVPPSCLSPSP